MIMRMFRTGYERLFTRHWSSALSSLQRAPVVANGIPVWPVWLFAVLSGGAIHGDPVVDLLPPRVEPADLRLRLRWDAAGGHVPPPHQDLGVHRQRRPDVGDREQIIGTGVADPDHVGIPGVGQHREDAGRTWWQHVAHRLGLAYLLGQSFVP